MSHIPCEQKIKSWMLLLPPPLLSLLLCFLLHLLCFLGRCSLLAAAAALVSAVTKWPRRGGRTVGPEPAAAPHPPTPQLLALAVTMQWPDTRTLQQLWPQIIQFVVHSCNVICGQPLGYDCTFATLLRWPITPVLTGYTVASLQEPPGAQQRSSSNIFSLHCNIFPAKVDSSGLHVNKQGNYGFCSVGSDCFPRADNLNTFHNFFHWMLNTLNTLCNLRFTSQQCFLWQCN